MADTATITLSASDLRFSARTAGPADGPVVVLLHGFPDSPATFRHQIASLTEAGFRVIVPRLRGYEPSSQPADGDYSLITLANDVIAWLDDLGVERAHLVGHDWGAAIAYTAVARNADRFLTLTTLAIPPLPRIPSALRHVPRQLQRSWYMTFFQLRGLAERALAAGDWRLMRRLWKVWSPDYQLTADEWVELRTQFEAPGVLKASLAYYRQNATPPILLGLRSTPAMEITPMEVPALIIHGAKDGCMDHRLFKHTVTDEDFPKGKRVLEVHEAGHFVHLEQPAEVNAALLGHFGNR